MQVAPAEIASHTQPLNSQECSPLFPLVSGHSCLGVKTETLFAEITPQPHLLKNALTAIRRAWLQQERRTMLACKATFVPVSAYLSIYQNVTIGVLIIAGGAARPGSRVGGRGWFCPQLTNSL